MYIARLLCCREVAESRTSSSSKLLPFIQSLTHQIQLFFLECQHQESIRYQLVMGLVASRYHGMHGIRMNTERTGKI